MSIPESLRKQHEKWVKVVNDGNIDAYANLLTKDAIWIPPGQQPIIGREAFRQWLSPFFEKFSYEFSITEEQFIITGNWTYERAKFSSKMTPNSSGKPMTHSGTFAVFWHQNKDKNWYIERYIDDTDLQNSKDETTNSNIPYFSTLFMY